MATIGMLKLCKPKKRILLKLFVEFINMKSLRQLKKLKQTITRLKMFNRWRRGEDERVFEELRISPKQIGKDIEYVCNWLEGELFADSGD